MCGELTGRRFSCQAESEMERFWGCPANSRDILWRPRRRGLGTISSSPSGMRLRVERSPRRRLVSSRRMPRGNVLGFYNHRRSSVAQFPLGCFIENLMGGALIRLIPAQIRRSMNTGAGERIKLKRRRPSACMIPRIPPTTNCADVWPSSKIPAPLYASPQSGNCCSPE